MAKKSAARLERDRLSKRTGIPQHEFKRAPGTPEEQLRNTQALAQEQAPETNNWESLMEMRNANIQLFQQYSALSVALMDPNIQAYMTDLQYAANLAKAMNADVGLLLETSNAIYARHEGKTGPAQGDNDWMTIVGLYQEYAALIDNHQMLIVPVAHELTELLQAAANAHQAAMRAAAAQDGLLDKNVTSEVEFTEVSTGEAASNG